MTTQSTVEPGFSRGQFSRLTGDLWGAFRWVRDQEIFAASVADAVAHLTNEAAARDCFTRLCHTLDAGDLTAAGSIFTANASMNGKSDLLHQLASRVAGLTFSRHRFVNTLVRVDSGGAEMWLSCYLHQARVHASGDVDSEYSRCLVRFESSGADWRIADLEIGVDLIQRYGSEAEMEAVGPQTRDKASAERATRSFTTHGSPAFDGGRETWHALREDVWEAHHWFDDQQEPLLVSDEERVERLLNELLIRELLSNYAYAHDSRDLAWTAANFTDDAILTNDPLYFDGNAAVIGALRGFNRRMTVSFHRFSNPRLKFVSPDEAWFVAYYHVPLCGPEGRSHSAFGRYFSRLTRRSGRWQIVDWRIGNDPAFLPMELGV